MTRGKRRTLIVLAFLAASDPRGFRAFLDGLHQGQAFRAAFEAHLGTTVHQAWSDFVESVRTAERVAPSEEPGAVGGSDAEGPER